MSTITRPAGHIDRADVRIAYETAAANPVRGRLNAAVLRTLDSYVHRLLGGRKAALLRDLPATVVEIGPGTGANLRYYRPGTTVIAVEPNVHMHAELTRGAARYGIRLDLRADGAQALPFADGSVDAVVSTLVLCTVPDQTAVLAEIVRVLRPGGRLVFLEHVHAGDRTHRAVQRAVARPWRWLFEGCDVRRDTETALRSAGFGALTVDRYVARSVFVPINPQIAGVATR
jgi:SAM-dependent methyltransferase